MKTKNFFSSVAAAVLVLVSGCAKDQELYDKVNGLDERVSSLEKTVNELNKITIPGMQAIVASIQGKIYVSSVTRGTDGYTITFSDGTVAEIADGEDGEKGDKGDTPAISVTEVEGEFYWAVDGEPLLDKDGKKIPVHSAVPQLRISEGKWQISYDEGTTWADVEVLGNPGGSTISIEDGDTTVTFIINGEPYTIQKELPFYLVFNARKDLGIPTGEEFMYEYSIAGAAEGDEIEVDILNSTAGWEARVITLPKGETPGYIGVKHNENATGKVFVYASNGRGKTDIKSLVFEEGVMTASIDVKPVVAAGGEVTVSVTSNMEYELYVDKTQKWISIAPETKAASTYVHTLVCEANTTGEFRSAEVDVINVNTGETPNQFFVLQYPSEAVTTDIASLENVSDGSAVTLYKETVLASSQISAVVSDGENYLVVKGIESALPVGQEITLNGVKTTDSETGAVSVTFTSYAVTAETSAVTNPESNYIGIVPYFIPAYTIVTGKLSQNGDAYSVTAIMGQTVNIEAPLASIPLASKVGSYVNIYGYVTESVVPEGEEAETDTMIATAVTAINFKENNAWTLSYGIDENPEDPDYPELITNTVSGSTVPYMLGLYTEEEYAEGLGSSPVNAALMLSDDLMYYFYRYGNYYDREEIYGTFVHADGATGSDNFPALEYGKYVAVAVGIAADGTPTGDYKTFEFEKKEPVSIASYADFIGKWNMGGSVIEVTEKVSGSTYNVTGLPSQSAEGISAVEAEFTDGKFILKEQKLADVWYNDYYGDCDVYFCGYFSYNSKVYPAYGVYTDTPETILTAYKLDESGDLKVVAGTCEEGGFVSLGMWWSIREGEYAGRGNTFGKISIADMTKLPEASEAYKAWLGNYTVYTKSYMTGNDTTYNVVLAEALPNETIALNGLGIDGIPLQYDAVNDKCSVVFGKFSASSSYDFYVSGVTNDGYFCTGDPDTGEIATLTKSADKSIKVENVVYKVSDERPEVYAKYWGIAGYGAKGWDRFSDVNYIVNPATLTPSAATASVKKTSSPKAARAVRADSRELKARWTVAQEAKIQKNEKKSVDARVVKSGRAALLKLK